SLPSLEGIQAIANSRAKTRIGKSDPKNEATHSAPPLGPNSEDFSLESLCALGFIKAVFKHESVAYDELAAVEREFFRGQPLQYFSL
ncbi:MAG: hypothetical protein M3264_07405, partial [Thermoproteota archaeon]|nr:hypothetical protein [Thermoproteota archaeon]